MKTLKAFSAVRGLQTRLRRYSCLCCMVALCFIFMHPTTAIAEYCWMIGCAGNVGYVYIPGSQIALKAGVISTTFNGEPYRLDPSARLFREYGLPDVGSIVTLKSRSALLPYASLSNASLSLEVQKFAYDFDKASHTASLHQYDLQDFGNPMRQGARLKILSYLGDGNGGSSNLFALVSVVSD